MGCTSNLMANIGAIQFLIKNCSEEIMNPFFDGGKEYSSVIDLLTDILKSLGVNQLDVVYFLIEKFTNFSCGEKGINKWIEEAEKLDFQMEGSLCAEVENVVKDSIAIALSGILGCSNDPMIGDKYFDPHKSLSTKKEEILSEGGIVLKIKDIDPLGQLEMCPSSLTGRLFYFDNDMGINQLYKSSDFNAFLWYAANKSLPTPQFELNKCMWDNRYSILKKNRDWNSWLGSKKERFFDKNLDVSNPRAGAFNAVGENKGIKPILQIVPVDAVEPSLKFQISSQEYYRNRTIFRNAMVNNGLPVLGFNKTLYEFNRDYLRSIPLFSVKTFLAHLFGAYMYGSTLNPFKVSVNRILPKEVINKIIDKAIENASTGTDTCYFSFSNDELDSMLDNFEKMRYNAKQINSASSVMAKYDSKKANETAAKLVYSDGDENLSISDAIDRTIYTVERSGEDMVEYKLETNVSIKSFIEEMTRYFVWSSFFSPKIIFLFALNREILGPQAEYNFNEILKNFITAITKMIAVIVKEIVQYMVELVWNLLVKSITVYVALRTIEMVNEYIELLKIALSVCVPKFSQYGGVIDDVRYADIIPPKETPNKDKNC